MWIIILLLFFSPYSYGQVVIAYIEMKDHSGRPLQLEPNGRFAHMAIFYQNKWLHAHPYRGVELITEEQLRQIGTPVKVTYDFVNGLAENDVKKYMQYTYDNEMSWDSNEKLYCAELIGKLLKIEPLPMYFTLPVWNEMRKKSYGNLGLSPDDIYLIMQKRQRENKNQCKNVFIN